VTKEDIIQSSEIDRENRYFSHDSKAKGNIRRGAAWRKNNREQECQRNHENYLKRKFDHDYIRRRRENVKKYKQRQRELQEPRQLTSQEELTARKRMRNKAYYLANREKMNERAKAYYKRKKAERVS
jgi:hypothetical protein